MGKQRRDKAILEGKKVTGDEPFNFFMTLFYPADNLMILDYNRVLKSLGDHTVESFMQGLEENFTLEEIPEGGDTSVK